MDSRADQAIVMATLELMGEGSVRDVRIDAVARRAGVAKATIYRRYRTKDELVAAAVGMLVSEIVIPDTGSTRRDLRVLMRQAIALYGDPQKARLMASMIEEARRKPQLGLVVRQEFLAGRRAALRTVLERGVARGDLRTDFDFDLALDVLGGAIFYRLLVTDQPIDQQLGDGIVELILRGYAPPTKGRP